MNKPSTPDKAARDNRANQLNPRHLAYHRSRGESSGQARLSAQQARQVRNPGGNSGGTNQP